MLLDQVEIDDRGAVAHSGVGGGLEQRDTIAAHDVVEGQRARLESGQVYSQPLGEGGVEVDDAAVRLRREEAGGRVVEVVDRVLQFLEDGLLPCPLARDVGHQPRRHRTPARTDSKRPGHDPVPVSPVARDGRVERTRQADFLLGRLSFPQRLGNTVDRLAGFGVAGEGALYRAHLAFAVGAGEVGVGAVGVDDTPVAIADKDTVPGCVEQRPTEVVGLPAGAESDDADGAGKHRHHADDGEQPEDADDERLGPARLDQGQPDRHANQREGNDDQPADAANAFGAVGNRSRPRRRIGVIGHSGRPISSDIRRAPAPAKSWRRGWARKQQNST